MKLEKGKNKSYWLLVIGVVFELVGITFSFASVEYRSPYDLGTDSFELIFLAAVFVAPLIEETTFRGQHSTSKIVKTISILLVIGWTISKYQDWFNFTLGVLLIGIILLSKTKYLTRDKFLPAFIILNSLFFALGHLRAGEYGLNHDSYVLLAPLGTGLILNWICLNYRFRNAIFFHMAWNFLTLSILFLALQFPQGKTTLKETENGTLNYEKVAYYGDEPGKIAINNSELRLEGQSIHALFEYMEMIGKVDNSDDFIIRDPFTKYHLKYTTKHDTISYQDFFQILVNEGLLLKK